MGIPHRFPYDRPFVIRFRCPACNQKIKLREEDAGRLGDCPKCKAPVEAPRIEVNLPGASETRDDFEPGDEVGEYKLEKLVGRGGFAQVWRATKDQGLPVAIKIPHDTGAVRELLNEGMQLRRLNHPNIVRTIDINLKALPPHIVLEYVDGTALYSLVKRNRTAGEFFPLAFIEKIFLQVLDGVTYAHAQTPPVVHADLKPHNVLIADQVARIVDFGLGREEKKLDRILSTSVQLKSKRKLLGTEAYMAPEQKKGEATDERTDIFALGMMLQEMLCNEVYCGHTLPGELNPLAKQLDAVVKRATAAFPKMRYQTVGELREGFVAVVRPGGAAARAFPGEAAAAARPGSGIRPAVGEASGSGIRPSALDTLAPPRNKTSVTPVTQMDAAVDGLPGPGEASVRPAVAVLEAVSPSIAAVAVAEEEDLPDVKPLAVLLRDPRFIWIAGLFALVALALLLSLL
ncbi:MAG: putative serine/threonine-protein kinase [Planctomycetota bacterium]|nr:MAG: putative serine/threonine-protein kinase [Planctomycetota bacterium]